MKKKTAIEKKEEEAVEKKMQNETKNRTLTSSRHIFLKNLTSEKRFIVNMTAQIKIKKNTNRACFFN